MTACCKRPMRCPIQPATERDATKLPGPAMNMSALFLKVHSPDRQGGRIRLRFKIQTTWYSVSSKLLQSGTNWICCLALVEHMKNTVYNVYYPVSLGGLWSNIESKMLTWLSLARVAVWASGCVITRFASGGTYSPCYRIPSGVAWDVPGYQAVWQTLAQDLNSPLYMRQVGTKSHHPTQKLFALHPCVFLLPNVL